MSPNISSNNSNWTPGRQKKCPCQIFPHREEELPLNPDHMRHHVVHIIHECLLVSDL